MAEKTRNELYEYFQTGDIPTESQFADLIDSYLQISGEDGVHTFKPDSDTKRIGIGLSTPSAPLGIKSQGTSEDWLGLHDQTADETLQWMINRAPDGASNYGLNLSQQAATGPESRLFIQESTGNVGLGTLTPQQKLEIQKSTSTGATGVKMLNPASVGNNGWTLGHLQDPIEARDGAFVAINHSTNDEETLIMTTDGNVGINESQPYSKLQVSLPETDANTVISLTPDSGIANIGPITKSLVLSSGQLQARQGQFVNGVLDLSTDSLEIQPLGGGFVIHSDNSVPVERKGAFTNDGFLGVGLINPIERVDINGAIRIGDTTNDNEGSIKWDGNDFLGRTASGWASLTAGSSSSLWTQSGDNIYYNTGTDPRVGVATDAPSATLSVLDQEQVTSGNAAAHIVQRAASRGTTATEHRVGLQIENPSAWLGDMASSDVGLYVSNVSGQTDSNHNLAAVLNGNVVIGDLVEEEIGAGGSNVLAIKEGTQPATVRTAAVQLYTLSGVLHVQNESGDPLVLKQQPVLTPADSNAFGANYDQSVIRILDNMRARINELEIRLKATGLLE